jgi:hypothetical protein
MLANLCDRFSNFCAFGAYLLTSVRTAPTREPGLVRLGDHLEAYFRYNDLAADKKHVLLDPGDSSTPPYFHGLSAKEDFRAHPCKFRAARSNA